MGKRARQAHEPDGLGQARHKRKKDRRFGHHFVDFYNSSLAYGRKKRNRIRYLGWAAELFGYPDEETEKRGAGEPSDEDKKLIVDEQTNQKVREAVEKLSPLERRLIELFHFECRSYQEISRVLNKKNHKLEKIHLRALSKLKLLLSDYVKTRFKINLPEETECIICKSPFRQELDRLIRAKKEKETYKSLMRVFRERYGIKIKTPQVIIGHKRGHLV